MGFNIHILSGRNRSTNRAGHAALAASFNPVPDSMQKQDALAASFNPKTFICRKFIHTA